MNLPTKIIFNYPDETTGSISYTYDASGVKLQKKVHYYDYDVITDYMDGYQYETKPVSQGGRGYAEMLFFHTPEGYVKTLYTPNDLSIDEPLRFQYVYIYKDHLGNNRLSYTLDTENQEIKILEENNYYPFGLRHESYVAEKRTVRYKEINLTKKAVEQVPAGDDSFPYKYNFKEWQDELSLNWYDYGARNYDPALGRFMNLDPLAEQYDFQSPFVYANNNPIFFIDINGMGVDDIYIDENGNYLGTDGADTKNVRVVSKETWDKNGGQKGALTKSGTEYLQKSENSTLLVGTNKVTQPGYQKGISISDETWDKIEDAGGTRAEPVVSNESDNLIKIKPEHEVTEGPGAVGENEAVNVKPGQAVYGMVDAIATNRFRDASYKITNSFNEGVGTRVRVTNNGIQVTSFGDAWSFLTFNFGGRWGFDFPEFVRNKNKIVGVKGESLEEVREIMRNIF